MKDADVDAAVRPNVKRRETADAAATAENENINLIVDLTRARYAIYHIELSILSTAKLINRHSRQHRSCQGMLLSQYASHKESLICTIDRHPSLLYSGTNLTCFSTNNVLFCVFVFVN